MKQEVIVRFAPSPTGYLHIGGARTAIFNWLFAQKTGGKLILRIEDTDAERSTEESIKGIVDGMKWLGITWDEGPYFQTQFINEHLAAAKKLLDSGHAYKCFCSKEELEDKRAAALKHKKDVKYDGTCRRLTRIEIAIKEAKIPYTLRMKVPSEEGSVSFEDIVYGTIENKYKDIEDFVIVRSNGQPLYLLSNAVDDIRDRITHVIRGQDGLSNTHRQILIYQALGAPVPKFAHMSLTLDPKKAKISKRKHGELVAVHFYKAHGFLPWAFVNFLVLLGWATPESREIFSKEELLEAFSLQGISRANSIFNVKKDDPKYFTDPKAISINAHYLREMPVEEIEPYVRAELEKAGIWDPEYENAKRQWFLETLELIRSRFHVTTDFVDRGRAYFSDDFPIESRALKKNISKHPQLEKWLPMLADRLEGLERFTTAETENVIREMAETLEIKPGVLINGIRTVVTGQLAGPGMFDVLINIGQRRVVERLRRSPALF
ncbi:MAG: glutamate--tRNA ligase [Deltaproteobacteria bacterium]|nr:glutamate--tRNA ligase [Deltaproteobacteria bacterium]MBW1747901.1 glutamate--tRNA ligase [Deltaproteobacteria bacterium]MBW1825830.1 glutamate--tRNA ligase [Deltaproteobacteria bacterium]MBW2155037.1 glutamate--tRNA ligase [Deltaproteobacteria bacterium]MBW2196459.1 glutamate--tRNA ligase [Deltaproteobacteria bacterium]